MSRVPVSTDGSLPLANSDLALSADTSPVITVSAALRMQASEIFQLPVTSLQRLGSMIDLLTHSETPGHDRGALAKLSGIVESALSGKDELSADQLREMHMPREMIE